MFYYSTGGGNWSNSNNLWMSSNNHCLWYGVDCNADGEVIKILLENNNLTGTLPSVWKDLANLEILYLYSNKLTGTLPSAWQDLANLQALALFSNELTGTLPSAWKDLANLQYLDLTSNDLAGSIPASVCQLNINIYVDDGIVGC